MTLQFQISYAPYYKKKDTGILNMQDYQQIKHCGIFVLHQDQ